MRQLNNRNALCKSHSRSRLEKYLRFRLPNISGARVFVDETVLGLAAVMIVFRWELGLGRAIGLFALVASHEFSHLLAGTILGLRPRVIRLGLLEGYCVFREPITRLPIIIAGLAANVVLLIAAVALEVAAGGPESPFATGLYQALVYINAIVIIYNLLPLGRTDGHLLLMYLRNEMGT